MLKAKAYNTKIFSMYLAEKTLQRAEQMPNNPWAKSRATTMWALAEVFHVMDCGGRFFSLEDCSRYTYVGKACLLAYHDLHCRSLHHGHKGWNIVPKFHYFHHSILNVEAKLENPKWTS